MSEKPTDEQLDHEEEHDESAEEQGSSRFLIFNVMPSWLVSFIIHIVLIIVLAVAYWTIPGDEIVGLEAGVASEDLSEMEEFNIDSPEDSDALENSEVENTNESELEDVVEEIEIEEEFIEETVTDTLTESIETNAIDAEALDLTGANSGAAGQVSGRTSAESRRALVRKNGGSDASENAVKLALEWIKRHQLPNGSWSFAHNVGPNAADRASPNPGDFRKSPLAATSMCVMVYLGAGQTHVEGDYKEVVEKGLAFLLENGQLTSKGLSFYEDDGALYSHGLAAMTLCEAFAMTDDPRLAQACHDVIRFTEYCQDPLGGGWRYEPKQAGDTSAVGWQVMALKSASMCGVDVDALVIRKARRFLTYISSESGTFYGYQNPPKDGQRDKGVTSVGLLCQMYLGWSKENPALRRACKWLGERGPSVGDWKIGATVPEGNKTNFRSLMYYNYYETQVMHQYGGDDWTEWNKVMRDFLVNTQATEGPARGSWFFSNPDEGGHFHGGRLYITCLAAMTLEVYYRYLPLYDEKKVTEVEFELD